MPASGWKRGCCGARTARFLSSKAMPRAAALPSLAWRSAPPKRRWLQEMEPQRTGPTPAGGVLRFAAELYRTHGRGRDVYGRQAPGVRSRQRTPSAAHGSLKGCALWSNLALRQRRRTRRSIHHSRLRRRRLRGLPDQLFSVVSLAVAGVATGKGSTSDGERGCRER